MADGDLANYHTFERIWCKQCRGTRCYEINSHSH